MKTTITSISLITLLIVHSYAKAQNDSVPKKLPNSTLERLTKHDSVPKNLPNLSLEELTNIEIESYDNEQQKTMSKVPAQIFIITQNDIKINGWQNLEEIFQNIPGMYIINDYLWFGSDNFGVRGFFTAGAFGNLVVLVNGVIQKEDWYNSFPLSKINVPVEAIDKIEIIRGPMSMLYGSNSLLGSINIITNKKSKQKHASIKVGTNENYKASIKVSEFSKNTSINITAGLHLYKGIVAKYKDMMSDLSLLETLDLPEDADTYGQLRYNRAYFGSSLNFKDFYLRTTTTYTSKGVIDLMPGIETGHLAQINSNNILFGYKKNLNKNNIIKVELGHYNFRNRLDYKFYDTQLATYSFNDAATAATDIKVNHIKEFKKAFISTNVYYRHIYVASATVDIPSISPYLTNLTLGLPLFKNKKNIAVSTYGQYNITEKLTVLTGIRTEYTPSYDIAYNIAQVYPKQNIKQLSGTYETRKITLIPQVAIMYTCSPNQFLKIMYDKGIKEPSLGENIDLVRHPQRPSLKTADMHSFEINYVSTPLQSLRLNASLFVNHAKNLISRTNALEDGVMQLYNTNSGQVRTLGMDMGIMYNPTNKLNTSLYVTVQHTKNLQEGYEDIEYEYSPKFLSYLRASYNFYKQHTIALSATFVDKMQTYWTPDKQKDQNDTRTPIELIKDGHRIGEQTPPQAIVNANLRFNNLFNKGIFLNLYVQNLTNTEIRYPTTTSNTIFDKGTIGYSRQWNIGLGIEF